MRDNLARMTYAEFERLHPSEKRAFWLKIANEAVSRWWNATLKLRAETAERWAKETLELLGRTGIPTVY